MILGAWFRTAVSVLRSPWNPEADGGGVGTEFSSLRLSHYDTGVANVEDFPRGISLEDHVLGDESGGETRIDLSDTGIVGRNLLDRVVFSLRDTNGNLAGGVYAFMKDNIFGADQLDYSNISATAAYLDTLSRGAEGEGLRAIDTAKTVLNHLNDYVDGGGINIDGFKRSLFGEEGVLARKRLKDMKKATSYVTKNHAKLDEKKEYGMSIGKDKIDRLDASYTLDDHGKVLVNVNHNKSIGMNTGSGRIYWNSFDQMFGENISTRSYVTSGVKKSIQADHVGGNADMISGNDWKLNALRNYAKYLV